MSNYFESIPQVTYKGPDCKEPFAFKYYDAERVICGKKMKEHLPFAMAWWHNLCANGTLEELAGCAAQMKKPSDPGLGKQELLEQIMNEVMFK
jgi:xylose isomerase